MLGYESSGAKQQHEVSPMGYETRVVAGSDKVQAFS